MGGPRKRHGQPQGMADSYSPGVRAALRQLEEARQRAGSDDLWEFAVTADELRQAGATETDLRCLVHDGLAEHRVETTKPRARRRSFQPWGPNLALTARSCFVLTERGVEAAAALAPKKKGPAPWSERLQWDGQLVLTLDGKPIKVLKRIAWAQVWLLDAFQRRGWPSKIEFPVEERPGNAQWLRNTVRNLNRGLKRIQFHADGTKHGVYWVTVK